MKQRSLSPNIRLFLSVLGVILSFTFMGWTAEIPESPLPLDPQSAQPDSIPSVADSPLPSGDYLLVEKSKHLLHHYRDGELLGSYSVALGKNPADKSREWDYATPEGSFMIGSIKDSRHWTHDFGDGKGQIRGAYGPFFISIKTDSTSTLSGKTWTGIGIHGTHDPSSIGTDASEGCVRMHNDELILLKAALEGKKEVRIDIVP
jgi:lipoprotein-anchoring transpeptidase ErfK/SrfK